MQKGKWIPFLLVLCILVTIPGSTGITYASPAEQEKQEAQENLNKVNNQLEELKNQQEANKETLVNVTARLKDLFTKQSKLENEIKENELRMQ